MEFQQKETYEKENRKAFEEHIKPYVEALEKRRLRHQAIFKRNMLMLLVIIFGFPFLKPYLREVFYDYEKSVSERIYTNGDSRYQDQTMPWEWRGLLILMMIAALPVLYYRKYTRMNDDSKRYFANSKSYKESLINHALAFFGEPAYERKRGIPITNLHGAMILPECDEYLFEDYITGIYRGTKIEMSEARLITRYRGKRIAVFNGLLVVLDICSPDAMLRGPFRGNTVVIQDDRKNLEYIKTKFQGYERVNLPTKELERRFEVLTTDKDEAEIIVCERFLNAVLKLADAAHYMPEQVAHLDDKIILGGTKQAKFLGSKFLSFVLIPFRLLSLLSGKGFWNDFDVQEYGANKHVDIYKKIKFTDSSEVEAINEDIECSFYNGKVLITIPYKHDLFEPGSIVQPALVEGDLYLIFAIMNAIGELSDVITDNRTKVDQ